MHSPEIRQFIHQNSALFWTIPEDKKEEISPELLVETILNYGDMASTRQLFDLLGIKEVARLFYASLATSDRRKGNYQELTIHYFNLLFRKYAH